MAEAFESFNSKQDIAVVRRAGASQIRERGEVPGNEAGVPPKAGLGLGGLCRARAFNTSFYITSSCCVAIVRLSCTNEVIAHRKSPLFATTC